MGDFSIISSSHRVLPGGDLFSTMSFSSSLISSWKNPSTGDSIGYDAHEALLNPANGQLYFGSSIGFSDKSRHENIMDNSNGNITVANLSPSKARYPGYATITANGDVYGAAPGGYMKKLGNMHTPGFNLQEATKGILTSQQSQDLQTLFTHGGDLNSLSDVQKSFSHQSVDSVYGAAGIMTLLESILSTEKPSSQKSESNALTSEIADGIQSIETYIEDAMASEFKSQGS